MRSTQLFLIQNKFLGLIANISTSSDSIQMIFDSKIRVHYHLSKEYKTICLACIHVEKLTIISLTWKPATKFKLYFLPTNTTTRGLKFFLFHFEGCCLKLSIG